MAKKDFYHVSAGLVPRIVDEESETLDKFKNLRMLARYADQQINEFIFNLPRDFSGKKEKDKGRDNCTVYHFYNSSCGLILSHKPEFQVPEISATLPLFTLLFGPANRRETKIILEQAVNQFFLLQEDMDDGTLDIVVRKNGKGYSDPLHALSQILRKGKKVEARCNYIGGSAEYVIGKNY